jgi:hypothetical protein
MFTVGSELHTQAAHSGFRKYFLFVALLACLTPIAGEAQMVSPAIDPDGQPFSYPSKPTDEIGVLNAPSAAEVTPEGYLYTGFGELMFFTGPDSQPVSQRIHVLAKGYLPILSYDVRQNGLLYHFEMFAASMGEKQPDGPVVNFIRVTVSNPSARAATAFLAAAVRYQGESNTASGSGDNRFLRPETAKFPGAYQQPGETFSKDWVYGFEDNAFVRDGKVIYLFPGDPAPHRNLTLEDRYNDVMSIAPQKLTVAETTPTGAVRYSFTLQPGQTRSLDFAVPLLPVAEHDPLVAKIRAAHYETYRAEVEDFWDKIVDSGTTIDVAEKKVTDTFNASLIYDLLALNKVGSDYIQTVNQLHYHRFYLRDSSDIVHMYDLTGYPQTASQVLAFYPSKQGADGNFLSQPGQFDGWGQTLWIYAEHYRFTHDEQFANSVFPAVMRAIGWFEKATAADPMHVMPATDVRDNEFVPGHLTGYNFLALDGLDGALYLAKSLGKTEDAKRIEADRATFRKNFMAVLDRVTAKTRGYIPPDLDENGLGTDWGNLLSITPMPQLALNDPRIMETLKVVRAKYQEGITTYSRPDQGQFLHHYLTIKNTLTSITIGDQENAVRELYGELLHTSATQAGFEYAIRPWGDRDFRGNLNPHGWFASEYRSMLRYMFVREMNDDLHLLSVVSPAWMGAGRHLNVQNVPTYFGRVGFSLSMPDENSATLSLNADFKNPPKKIIVHVPWFYALDSAEADGVKLNGSGNSLSIPASTKIVSIRWHRTATPSGLSYEETVAAYKDEYRKRYDELLTNGTYYDWLHPQAQR